MQKLYQKILITVLVMNATWLFTLPVHAQVWGYPYKNVQDTYVDDFTPNDDDAITIGGGFREWADYPAADWSLDSDLYHEARFTVDDRNIYGFITLDSRHISGGWKNPMGEGYRIKVNGKDVAEVVLTDLNLNKAVHSDQPFNPNRLKRGEGTYVNVKVIDTSHGYYYRNFVAYGGYVYKGRYETYMEFAVPFAALGREGVDSSPSTTWNFNRTDSDGPGITYEGTSTGWLVPVVSAVILVMIGFIVLNKRKRSRISEK